MPSLPSLFGVFLGLFGVFWLLQAKVEKTKSDGNLVKSDGNDGKSDGNTAKSDGKKTSCRRFLGSISFLRGDSPHPAALGSPAFDVNALSS